jgi:hypothetical protein
MAKKLCEFCNEAPATHLEPVENGPVFGLPLEDGSANYCCHERWESDIQLRNKIAEDD